MVDDGTSRSGATRGNARCGGGGLRWEKLIGFLALTSVDDPLKIEQM